MAKKEKKVAKATIDKSPRWTVRGVPSRLQKAAGDVARARGQTLGQWLSEVVEAAVADAPEAPTVATQSWRAAIEERLAKLETALGDGEASSAGTSRGPGRKPAAGSEPEHAAV